MLRLVLLALYLVASFSWLTGNLDPDGQPVRPSGDVHGNLDPNGQPVRPSGDLHGNLDPDG